jgi:uncharacterized protein
MIIDSHCHAGIGDGLTGPWDTSAPLGNYLRRAAAAGIQKTVLFPAFHSDYGRANRQLAKIVRSNHERFFGYAFIHPVRNQGQVEQLVREAVERLGLIGIKVHRYDARITREICDCARRYQVPILYDVMGEVSIAHLLAKEYPDVNFIIPHLGSFADDWRAQKAFLDPLSRYANIYTDTSGVRRFDLLEEALQRAGPQKILFGSDGPWLHPAIELAKIQVLKLSPVEQNWILCGNFLRLTSVARSHLTTNSPMNQRRSAELSYPNTFISNRLE